MGLISALVRPRPDEVAVVPIYGYDGNARAVYEALLERGLHPWWLYRPSDPTRPEERALPVTSLRGLWALAHAGTIVLESHLVAKRPLRHARHRRIIQLWHGVGLKRLCLNDPGLHPRERRLLADEARQWDVFVVTTEFTAAYFRASFALRPEQVKTWGYPRHDRLVYPRSADLENCLRLRDDLRRLCPWTERVVLFCPTYREDGYDRLWPVSRANMSHFSTLLRSAGATCVCRWHPNVAARLGACISGGFGRTEWEAVLTASPYSPHPQWVWLRLADMLITDFSSIAYDFLALGRPVVVVASREEVESYQRSRGLVAGWENLLPGPLVTEDKELFRRVEEYLLTDAWQQAWAARYERVRNLFVGSGAGGATQRVADYVVGDSEPG